jgi:hypothetical protein
MKRIVLLGFWVLICAGQLPRAAFRTYSGTAVLPATKKAHSSQAPGAAPPASYSAITSTKVVPYPSAPPIPGPAGKVVSEPEFDATVLRVTDRGTLGMRFPDWDFHTPGSAMQNTFSTDSKMFYVIGEGMHILVFHFDPSALTSTYSGLDLAKYGWRDMTFSTASPDIAYGITGGAKGRIDRYNFSSNKERTVLDPAKCLHEEGIFAGLDISVSAGDSRILGVFGPKEDGDPYLVVWDSTQGCRWYDTQTGEVGGNWGTRGQASTADRFGVHQARISLNGKYAVITSSGPGWHIWNIDTLQVDSCTREQLCGGHFAIGYNKIVNTAGTEDEMHVVVRPLSNLEATSDLIDRFPKPKEWTTDKHWSWNNDNASDTAPVCGSTYVASNPSIPGAPLVTDRAWDNEIVCFATAGPQTVWRIAHTYSTAQNGFFSTPRGNISQDGRFYMFTSDWEDELGKDKSGHFRTDVFIVPLKQR